MYDLVSHSNGPSTAQSSCQLLYDAVTALYKTRARALVERAQTLADDELLLFFSDNWGLWSHSTKIISHILGYMERMWINTQIISAKEGERLVSLDVQGDRVWEETVLVEGLKERVCAAMLNLIQRERDGSTIQQHLLRSCVDCFKKMSIHDRDELRAYKAHFGDYFLERTREYYENEKTNVLRSNNPVEYMHYVQRRILEERTRVKNYLDPSTAKPLLEVLKEVFLQKDSVEWLQSTFQPALEQDARGDIGCLFRLMELVDALAPLAQKFEDYVQHTGTARLEEARGEAAQNPLVLIETVLAVYRRFHSLVHDTFGDNNLFTVAFNKGCSAFINTSTVFTGAGTGSSMMPAQLARYADGFQRRGSPYTGDALDTLQNDVVSIFRFIPDKDVFLHHYTRLLAKRFISGTSLGEEVELAMINKFKSIQGSEFTMKATRMISDMSLMSGFNADLQQYMVDKGVKPSFGVDVMVLCSGTWPFAPPRVTVRLPPAIEDITGVITQFYGTKHSGRKLLHVTNLSHADVAFAAARNRYQLAVTAYQMAVLAFCGGRAATTFGELCDETQLQAKVLTQQLVPLVRSRIFVCADGSDTTAWSPSTSFTVNPNFAYKKHKFSLVPNKESSTSGTGSSGTSGTGGAGSGKTAAAGEHGDEGENSDAAEVMRHRFLQLEAAVVRIMKSRRVLEYTELVKEAIEQVQRWFVPQMPLLKKVVESLVDQEYIRRRDPKTLEYIA